MTLPLSPVNNLGGFYTSNTPVNTVPGQVPVNPGTAPVEPQSPSGSVTGKASTWEYANSELAVQFYTETLVQTAQQGSAALSAPTVYTNNPSANSYVKWE